MSFSFPLRVYWEDTDAGGVVYYANYLKFAERARSEGLRSLGIHQSELHSKYGIFFVVKRCEIDYLKPSKLDDVLHVETTLQELQKVRMTMRQVIAGEDGIVRAQLNVEIVCVDATLRPTKIPEHIESLLTSFSKAD